MFLRHMKTHTLHQDTQPNIEDLILKELRTVEDFFQFILSLFILTMGTFFF